MFESDLVFTVAHIPGCHNYGLFSVESLPRGSSVTPGRPHPPGMLPLSLIHFVRWFSSLTLSRVSLHSTLATPLGNFPPKL